MKCKFLFALWLLAAAPAVANASTVSLFYSGADPDNAYVTSTGTGSASFNNNGQIGLADLTAFNFTFTVTSADPNLRYADTFTYGLADLISFNATASAGTLTAAAFRTGYETPPDGFLAPEYLVQTALRSGGLISYFGPGDDAQHGTLRISAVVVPEPAGWLVLSLPLALLGIGRRVTGAMCSERA